MKVAVELDGDQISQLVYDDLLLTRECFLQDMEADGPAVFSMNEVYDKMLIQKHIEALDLILEWYRDPNG